MDAPLTEAVLLRALGEHSKEFRAALSDSKEEILAQVAGINRRLDRVNGRLDKHDDQQADSRERLATLEAQRDAEAPAVIERQPVISSEVEPRRGRLSKVISGLVALALAIYEGFRLLSGAGR